MRKVYIPQKKAAKVPHPGLIIQQELEERGWTQADLAQILGKTEGKVSEIIRGRREITAEMAQLLGSAFGTSPALWLNLETNYRLSLAKKNEQAERTALKSKLYDLVPLRELIRKGHLPDEKDIVKLSNFVKTFLGIASLDEEIPLQFCLRASHYVKKEQRAINAWCKIVENRALRLIDEVPEYKKENLEKAIGELELLMNKAEGIRLVGDTLKKYGILFIWEKHLEHTGVNGMCCKIQEHPVIALTLRNDYVDSFWFTLFHELGHCLFEDYDNETLNHDEARADKFAQEKLIPPFLIEKFATKNRRTLKDIKEQAEKIGRHPSILLGQLQNRKLIKYSVGMQLKEKASTYLM